jgi:hypothetical protein
MAREIGGRRLHATHEWLPNQKNKREIDVRGTRTRLEEIDQFVHGHFDIPQDGPQQAWAERFVGVHRDSCRPGA